MNGTGRRAMSERGDVVLEIFLKDESKSIILKTTSRSTLSTPLNNSYSHSHLVRISHLISHLESISKTSNLNTVKLQSLLTVFNAFFKMFVASALPAIFLKGSVDSNKLSSRSLEHRKCLKGQSSEKTLLRFWFWPFRKLWKVTLSASKPSSLPATSFCLMRGLTDIIEVRIEALKLKSDSISFR